MVARVVTALAIMSFALVAPQRSNAADPLCAQDTQKFCANVPPGSGRTQACLREHDAELSKDCRARVDDLQREAGVIGAICRFDIAWFCSDVVPGGARIVACLEKNTLDLSPECKNQIVKPSK